MWRFSFTLLIILLSACIGEEQPKTNSTLQVENAKMVTVPFLGRQILVPFDFVNVSASELQDVIRQLEDQTEYAKTVSDYIAQVALAMTEQGSEYMIFVDQYELSNIMIIQKGEYVDFNKEVASLYLGELQNSIMKSAKENNVQTVRVESRYLKTVKSKMIKTKFKQYDDQYDRYETQYIITSGRKTFGIWITHNSDVDFEDIIRHL